MRIYFLHMRIFFIYRISAKTCAKYCHNNVIVYAYILNAINNIYASNFVNITDTNG